jgi:hypothetical protein
MDQPGKQRLRPARAVQPIRLRLTYRVGDIDILVGYFALTRFHRLPEFIVDNPELRNLGEDPLRFRIHARHAPPRARIFDVALPVPDQPANIQLVVDDAGAALYVAADRRVIPQFSIGAGDSLGIQFPCDHARADAGCKFPENAPCDNCLRFIDLAVAADRLTTLIQLLDDPIAVAEATAGFAILDATAQPTMRFRCEVFEE